MRENDGSVDNPFQLTGLVKLTGLQEADRILEFVLERVLRLSILARLYRACPASNSQREFLRCMLNLMDVRYQVDYQDAQNFPRQGPAIVVANHPLGGIDAMVLTHILLGLRKDVKFMANGMLQRIPDLKEIIIGVDPFGGRNASRSNVRPLREAVNWLNAGHMLMLFPAGEVSHIEPRLGQITDPKWSKNLGRLVNLTRVPVVPVYVHGRNSLVFQLFGLIHPRLRTLLLPRELLKKSSSTVSATIGAPIAHKTLDKLANEDRVVSFLRLKTYMLQDFRCADRNFSKESNPVVLESGRPIRPPVCTASLTEEIDALPGSSCLGGHGDMRVYFSKADRIPHVLQEIGRLREITFRATGEGTGKSCDIDLYDSYYYHLVVWHRVNREVVGAYRMGLTDQILNRNGKFSLYSQTLFKYKRPLLERLNPAIELGRSFVRDRYSRSYAPLLLLWKGIGEFVARNAKYRILFGPVSISNDYQTVSRQLIVEFLKSNHFDLDWAKYVRSRCPFKRRSDDINRDIGICGEDDMAAISIFIEETENDSKGIPVLLRQYLKLGGRFLGFNIDRQFNDTLDGLILVDLCDTDPKLLAKYMGRDNADNFIEFHRSEQDGLSKAS